MTSSILLKYFTSLIFFSALFLGVLYLLRDRLPFWGRTALFLLFYVLARYSMRAVPCGLVPYLNDTPLFFAILTVLCLAAGWFYLTKIEKMSWREIGWSDIPLGKSVCWGGLALVFGIIPLVLLSLPIEPGSLRFTPGMIAIAATFGLILGGFFEETIFRGVIQTRLAQRMTTTRALALQAVLFSASHLLYFPFDQHAFFYSGTFFIGLAAGVLRQRVSILAACILHGGLVVAAVLAPDYLFGFLPL